MNKDMDISKKIADEVNKCGGTVYYVGGYVRDSLLGRENKDIDIEVYGVTPDTLKSICRKFGKIDEVGASFGVLKIKGYNLDITMPRSERATGIGHKSFEVNVDPFMSTKEAAMRRDITINAMMKHVINGEIVDHFGGQADLNNQIIRHIDDKTFIEDPLRVYRVAGFAARLQFNVAPNTLELCKIINTTALSSERIYEETNKVLLKATKPSIYFNQLAKMNQLDVFFPELNQLHNIQQDKQYHPEGDAWIHTMMVLDNAAEMRSEVGNSLNFMYAALMHDIGKTISTYFDEEKQIWRSIGHEDTGIKEAEKALRHLTNNKELIQYVKNMVGLHMAPHFTKKISRVKITNRLLDQSVAPKDLILLSFCDKIGRQEIDESMPEWWDNRIRLYEETKSKPEVDGNDLINLGYERGPVYSEILKKCHDIHLAGVPKEDVLKQLPNIIKGLNIKVNKTVNENYER